MSAAAVIVAAGAGQRLGGAAKALLRTAAGHSFLAAIVDTLRAAGVSDVVVVVGPPYRERVANAARELGVEVTDNPAPERGMASSVAIGFEYLCEHFGGADAALLWPVDHSAVRVDTVRDVLAHSSDIAVPTYGGRGGHPTMFRRSVWPELTACGTAADGARSVVRADPGRVARFACEDAGVVADVDTVADLG